MGFLDLFKGCGYTIRGALEGAGTLAKEIRESVTGEGAKLESSALENKALELANSVYLAIIKVTAIEAQGNWFQRSWRPGLAWVIILVIFVQYLLHPILAWANPEIAAPALKAAELWPIIMALIGYRTYEKQKGLT